VKKNVFVGEVPHRRALVAAVRRRTGAVALVLEQLV